MEYQKEAIETELTDRMFEINQVTEQLNVLEARRKQIEQRLTASEVRYRRLFETAQDGILIINAETEEIADVNPFLMEMLGYTKEHFLGKRLWEIGFFKDITASQQAFNELQTKGFIRYEDLPLETKKGRSMAVEFVSNVYMVDGDKVIQCNIRDITARKRAEEALIKAKNKLEIKVKVRTAKLSRANRQLRFYAAEVIRAHEDERKHVAAELHDQIGQSLTCLKLIMHHAEIVPSTEFKSIVDEAQKVLDELIQQVREMSLNLRPHMLDLLGLLPALLWHIERYITQTRIKVDFEHSGLNRSFSPDISIAVFRIMQEALTNIARHANVNEATIRIRADVKAIYLVVNDLGAGFNTTCITVGNSPGLSGMHERALLLGGTFNIDSHPDSGTCVTAEIPLSNHSGRAKSKNGTNTRLKSRKALTAATG